MNRRFIVITVVVLVVAVMIVSIRYIRIQEMNDIAGIAATDSSLIDEALSARKDRSDMGLIRLFTKLKNNINRRDVLIEKVDSLEVVFNKKVANQLVDLMKAENELLRSALFSDQAISSAVSSIRSAPPNSVERVYKDSRSRIDDYDAVIDDLIDKEKITRVSLAGLIPERRVIGMLEEEKKQLQTIIKDMEQELENKKKAAGKT